MRLKIPKASNPAPTATAVDLSSGSVHQDPGSYLTARSATALTTNNNGSGSNTNVSTFAHIDPEGSMLDGLYTWELERTNAGALDKTGVYLGFYDSASFARSVVAGIFETTSGRSLSYGDAGTVSGDANNSIAKCKVMIALGTNEDGGRVIGPGWAYAYDASDVLLESVELGSHTVTGDLKKTAGVRRGTSGDPAGSFGYTLTELRTDL